MNLAVYPPFVKPNHLEVCARSGVPGAHPTPNPVKPGTDLCGACHARFPRLVGDLLHYWPELHEAHVRRPRSKDRSSFQRNAGGGGVQDAGALWNPFAAVAINELADWAGFLMRTVIRERRFYRHERPVLASPRDTRTDVLLTLLATHHGRWLTEYPTLGPALLADAIRLRALAMRALDQPAVRRVVMRTIPPCSDVVWTSEWGEEVCGGLRVGLIPADAAWTAETGPARIVCSNHPAHTEIPIKEWLLYR